MKYYIDTEKKVITLHDDCSFDELGDIIRKNGGGSDWIIAPMIVPDIDDYLLDDSDDYYDLFNQNLTATI